MRETNEGVIRLPTVTHYDFIHFNKNKSVKINLLIMKTEGFEGSLKVFEVVFLYFSVANLPTEITNVSL